jgi:hypothetical protein
VVVCRGVVINDVLKADELERETAGELIWGERRSDKQGQAEQQRGGMSRE